MKNYLIVDGYNLLYALAEEEGLVIKDDNFEDQRDRLIDRMANYAGLAGEETILVFDAWASKGELVEEDRSGIKVVYTGKDQTADTYIERQLYELRRVTKVTLVTSDSAIQDMALLTGAERMSSRQFIKYMQQAEETHKLYERKKTDPSMNVLGDYLGEDEKEWFLKWRLGQN